MNALGTYILVSLSYVIGTMIEFAIVIMVHRRSPGTARVSPQDSFPTYQQNSTNHVWQNPMGKVIMASREKRFSYTEKIDICAFLVFAMSYCIFNSVYFSCYM